MERLTFKLGNSYGLEDKASSKVGLFTDYDGFYAYLVSTNRLGAYEDTGLTPEEIISIQKENTELKELLKLVVSDVFNTNDCEICSDIEECTLRETFNGHCGFWKWQHADKLKELGVE